MNTRSEKTKTPCVDCVWLLNPHLLSRSVFFPLLASIENYLSISPPNLKVFEEIESPFECQRDCIQLLLLMKKTDLQPIHVYIY